MGCRSYLKRYGRNATVTLINCYRNVYLGKLVPKQWIYILFIHNLEHFIHNQTLANILINTIAATGAEKKLLYNLSKLSE